jgi:LmbE family N-acetylglucosaminyl deacetylase
MKIKRNIILGCIIIGVIYTFIYMNQILQPTQELPWQNVILVPQDRILILAPHPDDEVLGCGGIIQKAVKLNLPVHIVFLTYGDNNQWSFMIYRKHPVVMPKAVQAMGLIRHDEAIAAAKVLGISSEQLTFLGYPDFRTLNIWYSHWGDQPPVESMLTEVKAVPYDNAFRPGALYKGEEILQDLKTILREFKPTKIFLSHPSDHHPDHRALYLFTYIALWDLDEEIKTTLFPYLIHYKKWPLPKGYLPDKLLEPPQLFQQTIIWQNNNLNNEEVKLKYNAIKKHKSQYNSNAKYLLSFIRTNELFGDFPIITLKPNISGSFLTSDRQIDLTVFPEQLNTEERTSFVGIEERFVRLEDNDLIFSIKLSRPIAEAVGVSVYIFGYRQDRPFQEMPKLHIRFGAIEHQVLDQNNILPIGVIKVERNLKEIKIWIPLDLLGNPQRILTSADTYLGTVPLDWVSWRILEISN